MKIDSKQQQKKMIFASFQNEMKQRRGMFLSRVFFWISLKPENSIQRIPDKRNF